MNRCRACIRCVNEMSEQLMQEGWSLAEEDEDHIILQIHAERYLNFRLLIDGRKVGIFGSEVQFMAERSFRFDGAEGYAKHSLDPQPLLRANAMNGYVSTMQEDGTWKRTKTVKKMPTIATAYEIVFASMKEMAKPHGFDFDEETTKIIKEFVYTVMLRHTSDAEKELEEMIIAEKTGMQYAVEDLMAAEMEYGDKKDSFHLAPTPDGKYIEIDETMPEQEIRKYTERPYHYLTADEDITKDDIKE